MPILFAVISAIFYGVGDELGGVGVQRSGRKGAAISMAAAANITSVVFLGVFVLISPPENVNSEDVLWPALAGLLMAATRPLLYEGMARGPITVFAPGFGLTMIAVPSLVGPFIGERLSVLEVLGVICAVPAVVLLSSQDGPSQIKWMDHLDLREWFEKTSSPRQSCLRIEGRTKKTMSQ